MNYSKKIDNDKFYTKETEALNCIKKIDNILSYDLIIEPSAGNGSFSKNIPSCIAYDISPDNIDIIKQDFLKLPIQNGKRILFIGNPPFGIRNQLSKAFIKHCIKIGATSIAFILPDVYNKYSHQSIFPRNWNLKSIYKLPDYSFIANNKEVNIPCSFFVWTNDIIDINLRKIKLKSIDDFQFLNRGDKEANFCINGITGKTKLPSEVSNPKAEHYIKTNIPRDFFDKLVYPFFSSVNGGISWLSQQEILEGYFEYKLSCSIEE